MREAALLVSCPHCKAQYHIPPNLIGENAECPRCGKKFSVSLAAYIFGMHTTSKRKLKCPHCGKDMHRVPEVLDYWFDSGAMPFAQHHYPFENKELFEKQFPTQFI